MSSSGVKGLIFLEPKSAILYEQLFPRIMEGKREPCETTFNDFDDVSFKVTCNPESLNLVQVNMNMKDANTLKALGSQDVINRLYPNCEINPAEGYNIALQIDCDNISDRERFLTNVGEMRKNIMGGPLDRAFSALLSNTSQNIPPFVVEYRSQEPMFVVPGAGKVMVIFSVDFADETDKAVAKVFLQEFVEAQRVVRNAPPVSYSKEAPAIISSITYNHKPNVAGFLAFNVEERHVAGPGKDKAIALFTGFRNYLHYHIKCSKTYLHMRMRKKVSQWMLILNRAIPDVESEKKTASGKTFVKK